MLELEGNDKVDIYKLIKLQQFRTVEQSDAIQKIQEETKQMKFQLLRQATKLEEIKRLKQRDSIQTKEAENFRSQIEHFATLIHKENAFQCLFDSLGQLQLTELQLNFGEKYSNV